MAEPDLFNAMLARCKQLLNEMDIEQLYELFKQDEESHKDVVAIALGIAASYKSIESELLQTSEMDQLDALRMYCELLFMLGWNAHSELPAIPEAFKEMK